MADPELDEPNSPDPLDVLLTKPARSGRTGQRPFGSLGAQIEACNNLQHIATHCNTLQHIAIHCNTLQHASARRRALERAVEYLACCSSTS